MMQSVPKVDSPIANVFGIETPRGAVVLATDRMVMEAIQTLAVALQPWIDEKPDSPVVLVSLLEGGRFYAGHLTTHLNLRCATNFDRIDIKVSTRDNNGRPLEIPEMTGDIESLRNRRVLIVDDILDSGVTLQLTHDRLSKVAAELKSTVLVQKNHPEVNQSRRLKADYVGLTFSDTRWFSGAGMDMPGDPQGTVRNSSTIIAYPPMF